MMTIQQILEQCKNLVSQPDYRRQYLLDIRKNGRAIAGCFSNYIPEEIVAAAGMHPARIIGMYNASNFSRRPLLNPVCSFVQDIFAAACAGEFSSMDIIIFPNSCDSLKVLRQIWDYEIKTPPAYAILHPVHNNRDSILYFADQLRIFAAQLSQNAGVDISEAALKKIIEQYNTTRQSLRKLYNLRKTGGVPLRGSDAVALMTAGLILDRDEYNRMLQQVLELCSREQPGGKHQKRIMIIGPLVDHYPLLEKIEDFGACLVYEDITNGARYCDLDVETQGDLYENIAQRYLLADPSPTMNNTARAEADSFENRVRELNLDGVIFVNQKFCEPHVHNYLAKKDILKEMRINCLMLEIDHGVPDIHERDLLRIESFIETVGRN
jgi:benzoyl-CoA reductase subunit C